MHAEMKWWRPLSLLPVFKLFVVALLLVLVVVLELLFWKSERDDGLAKVDSQGYVRFSWVYVPAVVMLTAQTLVGMIAFSSVFIFPYYLLRTRASNTRRDILRDYVSQTAIQSVWMSAANRHLPVFFMALAMLLTPLLTIAVSGLYTAQPTDVEQIVSLTTKNQFNSSFIDDDFEDIIPFEQASLNIGLLLTQNFTFPLWTHDDIALPQLELQVPEDLLSNSSVLIGSNVTTSLPAIRAELSCTVVPGNPANFSDMIWNKEDFTGFTDVGCGDTVWPLPGSNAFGFFSLGYNGSVGPGYCGAYGTSETNWRAFVCGSQINQLDVNVTLDASSLAVLEASSDESTSRLFSNRTLTMYRLSSYPSSLIPSIFGSANFADPTTSFYDPGFQAVIYEAGTTDDPNKFPIADYMDDAGFRRLSAGLTHVYRTIIAQTANLALRVPLNTSAPLAPPATVNGTLTNPNVYRLRQSAVSTRILDGLLVAVALCIAVSFGLMDTRRLLPKNPAPIAAGASLLAGKAEMLRPDLLPKGAQWCSDSELEKRGVWDGFVFSLGWWNSGSHGADGGESKRFGIDIGKADS
ncbi:hypothetical protein GTA08_BOTSDO12789 [Neofusicoccum parvum]|nr:hypothetical protein GTA08_BOTSDO12789 [Neofusicoccum parvum]